MKDMTTCPICNNKLRSVLRYNQALYYVETLATYVERTCTLGMNQSLQFYTHVETDDVHLMKVSLTPNFSKILEVDLFNGKSRIICLKENKPQYIDLPQMIELDFPDLKNTKSKVNIYVTFS
jgi:hypothetical protein